MFLVRGASVARGDCIGDLRKQEAMLQAAHSHQRACRAVATRLLEDLSSWEKGEADPAEVKDAAECPPWPIGGLLEAGIQQPHVIKLSVSLQNTLSAQLADPQSFCT